MPKYCVRNSGYTTKIDPVTVERETEHSVYIRGRRVAKRSNYENYFDDWDDAHALLVRIQRERVEAARLSLEKAERVLAAAEQLTRPQAPETPQPSRHG